MKKITIVGGLGFVGSELSAYLHTLGYDVTIVDTRGAIVPDATYIQYTGGVFPKEAVADTLAIINLAGAPVALRWTASHMDLVRTSRVDTTRAIVSAIKDLPKERRPMALVSASAVGYYGSTGSKVVDENAPAGTDFLATVCRDWEQEAFVAEKIGVRVVVLRTAHVLGKGGIMRVLVSLFKKKIGGYFGSGMQGMPWVHIGDLVRQYVWAVQDLGAKGVYNTSAGEPISQKTYMQSIARYGAKTRICWRIPVFVARLFKGRMVSIFATGQRVDSTRIQKEGFVFKYTDIDKAVQSM